MGAELAEEVRVLGSGDSRPAAALARLELPARGPNDLARHLARHLVPLARGTSHVGQRRFDGATSGPRQQILGTPAQAKLSGSRGRSSHHLPHGACQARKRAAESE